MITSDIHVKAGSETAEPKQIDTCFQLQLVSVLSNRGKMGPEASQWILAMRETGPTEQSKVFGVEAWTPFLNRSQYNANAYFYS